MWRWPRSTSRTGRWARGSASATQAWNRLENALQTFATSAAGRARERAAPGLRADGGRARGHHGTGHGGRGVSYVEALLQLTGLLVTALAHWHVGGTDFENPRVRWQSDADYGTSDGGLPPTAWAAPCVIGRETARATGTARSGFRGSSGSSMRRHDRRPSTTNSAIASGWTTATGVMGSYLGEARRPTQQNLARGRGSYTRTGGRRGCRCGDAMSDCTSAAASFDAETRSLPLCDVTWAATPGTRSWPSSKARPRRAPTTASTTTPAVSRPAPARARARPGRGASTSRSAATSTVTRRGRSRTPRRRSRPRPQADLRLGPQTWRRPGRQSRAFWE